jgi:hypothetical protein
MVAGKYIRTEEQKKRQSLAIKGKHHSEETKKKMSLIRLQKKKELGYLISPEAREKLSLAHEGEKAYNWKGENAKYGALHLWIRKNKPKPKLCEECHKEKRLTLANIKNHKYTRNPDDYKWLCFKCHRQLDLPFRKKIKKEIVIKL